MKKLLLSLAAVAALAITGGSANAQHPGAGCQDCGGHPGMHSGYGYGGHGFGGFLPGKKSGGLGLGLFSGIFTNHGHRFGGGSGGHQQIPVVDPRGGNAGQLVFPQNPFIRSPRDFFMWDER